MSRRTCLISAGAAALGCAIVTIVGATTAPSRDAPTPAGQAPRLVEHVPPAGAGSAQPNLWSSPEGPALLSWLEQREDGATAFRFAEWREGAWSAARTIAEGHDFFVNWADVPAIARLSTGRLAASWLAKLAPGTYAYGVKVRVSDDGGRSWSGPIAPHRDASLTEHGFVSLFEPVPGILGLAWLDGRGMTPEGAGGGHDVHGAGAMTLRTTTLRPDRSLGDDELLDDRTCECCPTAATRTSRGVVVAYRDRDADEIRDIAVVSRDRDGWTTPRVPRPDNWTMPGCPVNGPALAADGARVALAWFTAERDDPRVLVAFSTDGGRSFGRPVRVSDGVSIGRVDVEWMAADQVLVSHVDYNDGKSRFVARRVGRDGSRAAPILISPVSSERASGYPRMARAGDTVVFAWTDAGTERRVRTATMRWP